ncbi:MAG TPA: hypothetical protein VKV77_05235 [Methylovirgula sp.]|nr:hypothetical protein [Methylovirgula sp.]
MTEGPGAMSADRFAALAGAYGAQLRHWPQSEQAAAAAFAATAEGRAVLDEAEKLDALLDLYTVRAPAPDLDTRILRQATARWKRRRWLRLELGLAGVGVAGMIAGMVMATILMPASLPNHRGFEENTAFSDTVSDFDTTEEGD